MKITAPFILLFIAGYAVSFSQSNARGNYTLPKNDEQYDLVKNWIEVKIHIGSNHPLASTNESFRDIKYGAFIQF